MRVLVTYSSRTGNTKKLADGIYEGLNVEDKVLLPMKEVSSIDEYDLILAGYWVDKAQPNAESKVFLESILHSP